MPLNEDFSDWVLRFGEPQNGERADVDTLGYLRGSLPGPFVDFVERYGFGTVLGGVYRLCDPRWLQPVLTLVLSADEDLAPRTCHAVAHTAFGELQCWSQDHGPFEISLPEAMVFSHVLAPTRFKDLPDGPGPLPPNHERFAIDLLPQWEDEADFADIDEEPMYEACRGRLGPVDRTQCYGFFPALAVAGPFGPMRRTENVKIVSALEHYAMLAQLDTFVLTRIGPNGYEAVRPVGPSS